MEKANRLILYFKKHFIFYLLAVIGVTAFFAHETFMIDDWRNTDEGKQWSLAKDEALIALDNLKESSKGTEAYLIYKQKADYRDKLRIDLDQVIEESKFFGFTDFQHFVGEFGWALGLFLYALFNLVLTFLRKPSSFFADVVYHVTHITISVFFLRWCFNRKDFLIPEYFAYNILTVLMVVISTYLFVRYKQRIYKGMQSKVKTLFSFIYSLDPFIKRKKLDDFAINRIKVTEEVILEKDE